jgi:hypothetical protein
MKRRIAFLSALAGVTVLALGALLVGSETAAFPEPIGCGADGYCNPFCTFDPDCGPPACVPGKPCRTDADCQPLGYCATYRLCVCTG